MGESPPHTELEDEFDPSSDGGEDDASDDDGVLEIASSLDLLWSMPAESVESCLRTVRRIGLDDESADADLKSNN